MNVNTFDSQLSISLENIAAGGAPNGISRAYLMSYHDVFMDVSDRGITVAV